MKVHLGDAHRRGRKHTSLLTYEYGSEHFEHCGKEAGLPECENPGAYRSAEGVGHIVGSHAESQHKGYDEAGDDKREKLFREWVHFRCCVKGVWVLSFSKSDQGYLEVTFTLGDTCALWLKLCFKRRSKWALM